MTPEQQKQAANTIGVALLTAVAADINRIGSTDEGREIIALSVATFINTIKSQAVGFGDFDARVLAFLMGLQ